MATNKYLIYQKLFFISGLLIFGVSIILGPIFLIDCVQRHNDYIHTFPGTCVIDTIVYTKGKEYIYNGISKIDYNVNSAQGYIALKNIVHYNYYYSYSDYHKVIPYCNVINNEQFNCTSNVTFSCFYNEETKDVLQKKKADCNYPHVWILLLSAIINAIILMYNTHQSFDERRE